MVLTVKTFHQSLIATRNTDHFLSELGWREFSNSLLYFFPDLPSKNLQSRFDNFDWIEDPRRA